jgi:hypothetical protein
MQMMAKHQSYILFFNESVGETVSILFAPEKMIATVYGIVRARLAA